MDYENCYEILKNVRYEINEYDDNFMDATDTSCPHQNDWIIKQVNLAQQYIYNIIFRRIKMHFLESASLTASSSVLTLPSDFGLIATLYDPDGRNCFPIKPNQFKIDNIKGLKRVYYRKNDTYVIEQSGVSDTYTLWYYRRPRELNQGVASAGAASSITLATTAKIRADYYNGMYLEDITAGFASEITGYSTVRVATVSGTAAASDVYGTVSDLPEMFHLLIAPKAVHLVKAASPVIQEKPTAQSISEWNQQLLEVLRSFAGSDETKNYEALFTDYDSSDTISSILSSGSGFGQTVFGS